MDADEYVYKVAIYALYNKSDQIVFVGTKKECCKYLECDDVRYFTNLFNKKRRYRGNMIYHVFDEEVTVTEIKCSCCGKVKKLDCFKRYYSKSSKKMLYRKQCNECMKLKKRRK